VNVTASEKIPVSVALIAYNEESNISRCLDSLRDFDDIVVVVDSRTNDRTAEISEEFGCRVFVEEWRGSGPQKQYSIDRCKNDWVLLMDADESLTPETIDTIKNLVGNATADAYGFRRKTYIGNRWIKHCAWWPDRVVNNYYHFIQKVGRFASVDAAELYRQGRKANYLSPIVHGAWMFFRAFFLKRGFMGGLDGLSVSVATGVKAFFKYAILIEMQRYKD
jgi:glycosyltransferase involved in cell wall biosynthesis